MRGRVGDYLLAEENGGAVGTATSLSLKMWVRGASIPCQGVAWVGAIKTARRRGGGSPGVATAVMNETLRMGRQRGDVVSALMPFRASFYEHFGYGVVERRNDWTIPLAVLPSGPCETIRFYTPGDFAARAECLRRINRLGQCDVERSDDLWRLYTQQAEDGMQFVDRPEAGGPVRGSMYLQHQHQDGVDILRAAEMVFEDHSALLRQLYFLSTLRDQYSTVQMNLPADLPLNRLLKEVQLPHRDVNHAFARANPMTRLQLRVLDHKRFLESLAYVTWGSRAVVVAIHECEGTVSKFKLEVGAQKVTVEASDSTAEFECQDRTWAAIATGDLSASSALRWGLADGTTRAAGILDWLSRGPTPFCHEYF